MIPTDFLWAVGEECSDPLVPFEGREVRVDEMESTGHLANLERDLSDVADLGVRLVRYGINWRRTEPEEGRFRWDLWDRAFAAFDRLGLQMVVDFLHFGTPPWLTGVSDARLPQALLRYAEAFLARYSQPQWFTPVNEPYVTAYASTLIGAWNEAVTDQATFIRTLTQLCLADLLVAAAIRGDRPANFLHAEAFSIDQDGESPAAIDEQNALRLLSFDLRYGLDPLPATQNMLLSADDSVMSDVASLASKDGVVSGHDFYPATAPKDGTSYATLARAFHARYEMPFMIGETSNLGLDPADGPAWLEDLFLQGCALRSEGLPFLGICWYSRGDQHDWDSMLRRPVRSVTPVGLFDMERRKRPAADAFAKLMQRQAPAIAG